MDLFTGVIILFIALNIVRMLLGGGSRRPRQSPRINHADEWRSQPFNFPPTGSMPYSTHAMPPTPIIVEQPVQYWSPASNVDTPGVAIGTAAAIGLGGVAAYEIEQAIDNAQNWSQPDPPADTFGVNFPDNSNYGTTAFDTTNAAFDPNAFAPQQDNSWASTPSFDSLPSMDTSSMSSPSTDTSSSDF